MKNIYVIPTEKPSRLFKDDFGKLIYSINIDQEQNHFEPQHIYITNDEEIKEGDWGYSKSRNKICKVTGISKWTHKDDYSIDLDNENYFIHHSYCKKIILTTDQDLIKDGVQAIDDDFLEWFVKNPSCEEVEVDKVPVNEFGSEITVNGYGFDKFKYKIIIPKETLEEAAKKLFGSLEKGIGADRRLIWMNGAKWQQERSYSEEEILELLQKALTHRDNGETGNLITAQGEIRTANFYSWFEQNKKK